MTEEFKAENADPNAHLWQEFRDAGLLWWVNRNLHLFGWAIHIILRGDKMIGAFPDRVDFLGFTREDEEQGFATLRNYLDSEAEDLNAATIHLLHDPRDRPIEGRFQRDELAAVIGGDPGHLPYRDCSTCGRRMVWNDPDTITPVWMCPRCVHRRMVAAEEKLERIQRS